MVDRFLFFKKLTFQPSFEKLANLVAVTPASFLLETQNRGKKGYSYFGFNPKNIFTSWTHFNQAYGQEKIPYTLKKFPWMGGWMGFVTYENQPWFGSFPIICVLNHENGFWYGASLNCGEKEFAIWEKKLFQVLEETGRTHRFAPTGQGNPVQSSWILKPDFLDYSKKIEKIKHYLEAGDIYQANLTEPFQVKTNLLPHQIYLRLKNISPVNYAAFLNTGNFFVISSSPELFFSIENKTIKTSPIKGTSSRGENEDEDEQRKKQLLNSSKDRAELLMITDLERNDLGRVCQYGSVITKTLYRLETISYVHHLVSDIVGKLKEKVTLYEIFQALFPGGSVTGAPKKRAMEILAELEKFSRGVYTGALGYISLDGDAGFNLPIRTLTQSLDTVYFNAGGGIVMDSKPDLEFEELMLKISKIRKALDL